MQQLYSTHLRKRVLCALLFCPLLAHAEEQPPASYYQVVNRSDQYTRIAKFTEGKPDLSSAQPTSLTSVVEVYGSLFGITINSFAHIGRTGSTHELPQEVRSTLMFEE